MNVDKCMGKEKQRRLIDIISKVARVYASFIIFLDAGEKLWLKEVPPEEKYNKWVFNPNDSPIILLN